MKLPLCVLAVLLGPLAACAQDTTPERHALLVGCTKYPKSRIRPLAGPVNDVKMIGELLTSRYGFSEKNIARLVGWPDAEKDRPTYQNITAGMKQLVAKSAKGVQIVILLAGHGVQVPIPPGQAPLDPKNPEPDGMDEVFLPADVEPLDDDTFKNGLKDDEVGEYLRAMQERGASVWVIFDCCHSGTMTRGKGFREVPRSVKPQDLGISDKAVRDAIRRAQDAASKQKKGEVARGRSSLEAGALDHSLQGKGKGSIVAFYAAQPFEETLETLRPDDAEEKAENYYGLLSSAIVKVLGKSAGSMSYRDLSRQVLSLYTAERGARGPNPFIEGDVQTEVLGAAPLAGGLDIVLRKKKGKLILSAGSFAGMTPGSIVSVHAPGGVKAADKEPLGYVRVTRSNPVEADVVPCPGPDEKPAAAESALPDLGRCKIVSLDLGDMKLKIAVRGASDSDQPDVAKLLEALKGMNKEIQALWNLADSEGNADWVLWVEKGKVRIRRGQGQEVDVKEQAESDKTHALFDYPRDKEYSDYSLSNAAQTVASLERDIQAISTWQNLWRISGVSGASGVGSEDHGLKMEIQLLGAGDKEIGPIETFPRLHVNQRLRITLKNDGYQNLWVTMLSLSGDCGISVFSMPLERGKTFSDTGTLEQDAWGKEGMIVLAVPQKVFKEAPNFDFLEQEPLTRLRATARGAPQLRGEREAKFMIAPKSPFTDLLRNASLGKGATRGWGRDVRTNPSILSQAWITLPPPAKK